MMQSLAISETLIPRATKGIPASGYGVTLKSLASFGWNLLAGDLPTPVAVVKKSAIESNIFEMARFAAHHSMRLAPHGKTTMCPQLFIRQVEAGAWGMTVASLAQAEVCLMAGINRLIIANQIVGEYELKTLASMLELNPHLVIYSLVDSTIGADKLQAAFFKNSRPANVLLELGEAGGRCGCRTDVEMMAVARHITTLSAVNLCGVEGFEGLWPGVCTKNPTALINRITRSISAISDGGFFSEEGDILITAGGSALYYLVANAFSPHLRGRIVGILRSGCYITHDDGFYGEQLSLAAARAETDLVPQLRPALEIWATILSCPEPGLAILNAGKRDLGYDQGYATPKARFRRNYDCFPASINGCSISAMNDQHGYMRYDEVESFEIGDLICLGISHPCTTFDKWQILLEVDEKYTVVGGLKTFF